MWDNNNIVVVMCLQFDDASKEYFLSALARTPADGSLGDIIH
jgi:hypothetical protein